VNRRDLQAGQIIDGFRLVEPLESGGMASFWRVTRDGDDPPMVMRHDGIFTVFWLWLRVSRQPKRARPALTSHLANAPIVVAEIDLEPGNDGLNQSLAIAVRRILATESNSRLACVNVLKIARLTLDDLEDAQGRNPHLGRLIELKHWARSIPIAPERITYHVLESTDPAGQLIDYARHNRVDHIVIGARGSSMVRRYLGSVSARVVAEAPCTVTVVRRPREEIDAATERVAAQRI
jgi:eukaryotic-like serine/threonine-protein kinase